jgi:death-on-curing protein
MENISYHIAAGSIDKELLQKIIHSILQNEEDFNEELKLNILEVIKNQSIGFDEEKEP